MVSETLLCLYTNRKTETNGIRREQSIWTAFGAKIEWCTHICMLPIQNLIQSVVHLQLCTKKLRLFLFGRGHKKAKRQKAFNAINLMIYNNILVAWLVFLLWSYLRISLQTQFVCQNWNSIVEFHSFKPLFVSK